MVQPTAERGAGDVASASLERLYAETCAQIRASDEISFKLLGLVPLVSGVGILVLLGDEKLSWSPATAFASVVGAVVTFALYRWEMRNVDYCSLLVKRAAELERNSFKVVVRSRLGRSPQFGIGRWSTGGGGRGGSASRRGCCTGQSWPHGSSCQS